MVRHWVLVPAFGGSNPSALAIEKVQYLWAFSMGERSGLNQDSVKTIAPKPFRLYATHMSYKTAGVAIVAIALVAIGAQMVWTLSHKPESATTLAALDKTDPKSRPGCLAKQDNPDLTVPISDQQHLTWAAIDHVLDVPAGTNVNIYLKTYDGNMASGTSVYAGDYGAYNFTAKTHGPSKSGIEGNWVITSFVACKG